MTQKDLLQQGCMPRRRLHAGCCQRVVSWNQVLCDVAAVDQSPLVARRDGAIDDAILKIAARDSPTIWGRDAVLGSDKQRREQQLEYRVF